MQAAMQTAQTNEQQIRAKMDAMAADFADSLATLGAGGGGTGGGGGGVSEKELDQVRDALDQAQDEIVALSEAKESLEQQLQSQRKICELLQQLSLNSGLLGVVTATSTDNMYTKETVDGVEMEGEEKQAEEDGGNAMFFRLLGGSSSVASFGAVGSTRGGRRDGIIELSDVVASIKRAIVKVMTSFIVDFKFVIHHFNCF